MMKKDQKFGNFFSGVSLNVARPSVFVRQRVTQGKAQNLVTQV
jgi:hypothetical protein